MQKKNAVGRIRTCAGIAHKIAYPWILAESGGFESYALDHSATTAGGVANARMLTSTYAPLLRVVDAHLPFKEYVRSNQSNNYKLCH